MTRSLKLKIVFFASSTLLIKQYWRYLDDKADCWWVVTNPYVHDELKELGCEKIFFKKKFMKEFRPEILYRFMRKVVSSFKKHTFDKRTMDNLQGEITDKLNPDIWISDTTLPLMRTDIKALTVLVFHSVCYKKYYLVKETLGYDLILLPGEHHKKTICERFNPEDVDRLKVVGWPRVDNFINSKFTEKERDAFVKQLNLNPKLRNVMYAPTYDAYKKKRLFPESFGSNIDAFEEFCKRISELDVNLIIKLHHFMAGLIRDKKLHRIAEKYHVCFAYKKSNLYIDNLTEYFLWVTDVLIGDVSGIIMDFMVLDRPIVYIEPDGDGFNWEDADLPKEFRAGKVTTSMDGLIRAVKDSLDYPDEYKSKREEVLRKVFYKLDGKASEHASLAILKYYKKFQAYRQKDQWKD